MGTTQVSQEDIERAHWLVDDMLRVTRSPQEVRRRVERILTHCDGQSERYAFWRLILALVISGTGNQAEAARDAVVAARRQSAA